MNWKLYYRYIRKECNGLCLIPWILFRGISEARWARDVIVYDGPDARQNEAVPVSHAAGWPYRAVEKITEKKAVAKAVIDADVVPMKRRSRQ